MMTPFMQARLWWRRGSAAERMSVSVAALVVLALIVWVATPTGTNGDTDVAAGTAGASGQASEGTPRHLATPAPATRRTARASPSPPSRPA